MNKLFFYFMIQNAKIISEIKESLVDVCLQGKIWEISLIGKQIIIHNLSLTNINHQTKSQSPMHNNEDFQAIKPFIYENYQEYRILQPNVIFIHGLPQKYSNFNQLNFHLSNYGKIQNISIQFISKNFYSSFVEYETQISACLAVTALDGYYIDKRFLKVSFASTKFCPNFLKGSMCFVENCNYAHYYVAELAHLKDFAKQINHRALAFNKIWENYQEAFMLLFRNEQNSLAFPSGSIKLNEILFVKSEEFQEWQRKIQESIEILEKQLQKLKANKSLKSLQKTQSQNQENEVLFKDDWLNLDDSISDFLEQEAEENIKNLKRSKTQIQKFLDEAESSLMGLIFKSGMQQVVLEAKNS